MKRGIGKLLIFGFVLILLVGVVSANGFTDFFKGLFGKDIKFGDGESSDGGNTGTPYRDTSKTVVVDKYGKLKNTSCTDSDHGIYPGVDGFVSQKVKSYNYRGVYSRNYDLTEKVLWDYCNGDYVVDYYCGINGTIARPAKIMCENGCENGECKQLATCQQFGYQLGNIGASCGNGQYDLSGCYNETKACTDFDALSNPLFNASNASFTMSRIYGRTCSNNPGSGGGGNSVISDYCVNTTTISEASCTVENNTILRNYTCSNGCANNKCRAAGVTSANSIFIDFGTNQTNKTGYAVVGNSGDYWNGIFESPPIRDWYTIRNYTINNLSTATGQVSQISAIIIALTSAWNTGNFKINDPMFNSYIFSTQLTTSPYSPAGFVILNNTYPGLYDLYLYGHGDNKVQCTLFTVSNGSTTLQPPKITLASDEILNSTTWKENLHYIVYKNITVHSGDAITIRNSFCADFNYFPINGLQLVPAGTPVD